MRNSFNSGVRKHLITLGRKTPRRTLSAPQDAHMRALTALLMLALLFRAVKTFSRLSGAETAAGRGEQQHIAPGNREGYSAGLFALTVIYLLPKRRAC